MTDTNLPALRNQVREQRQTIRLRQLSLEAKRNERLMESYEYLDRLVDMPDRWAYQDRLISPMGTVLDRRDGQYGPIIRTLNDLDLIRGFARVLNELNPLAIALTGHLTDSIIGTGFTFRAVTKEETRKGELRPLIAATQDVIDEFYEREEFDEFQQELFGRSVVDGESILRHYDLDGFATVRSVEPEQLRVPPGESGVGPWSFGIHNARHDVQTPVEFYVTYKDTEDGADGMSGEYVPAADIVHTKRNTPRNVKRGFSDFFPVREDMEAIRKLLHNMVVTGGVQAAVAWFRNWSGSQQSDIINLRQTNADLSGPRPPSRNDVYFQKVWPGQVVDAPANMKMDGPPQGTMNVPGHVQVVQAMMRAIGIRWRMPEYFTGDASNANFACHDSETELLTRRGWVRYDDLRVDDRVGTMNPETGQFEWQMFLAPPTIQDYDGEMVRVSSRDIDLLVTLNHRMYTARHRSERRGGRAAPIRRVGLHPFEFKRADELRVGDVLPLACLPHDAIPVECFEVPAVLHARTSLESKRQPKARTIPMTPWLSFLGWFVSEGWTVGRGQYAAAVSQTTRFEVECEAVRVACRGLGTFNVKEWDQRDGMTRWQINDKSLWTWLRENCGTGSYSKRLPDFVFDLPAGQTSGLLESLILGDGADHENGSHHYFTVSRALADQVQILALMNGRISNMERSMKNGVIPISIRRPDRAIKLAANHVSRSHYRGVVWCVTVPNGLVITRRNGKAIVTGNSTTVAGSPFVRYATSQQRVYRRRFLRTIWYALDCAIAAGRLDRRVKQLIDVEAEAPAIEMADELKKAQADSIKVQGGWKSRQKCAQEDGNDDWDQTQADMDAYREANPEAAGQMLQLPPGYGQGAAG